jgi:hypothetical protein
MLDQGKGYTELLPQGSGRIVGANRPINNNNLHIISMQTGCVLIGTKPSCSGSRWVGKSILVSPSLQMRIRGFGRIRREGMGKRVNFFPCHFFLFDKGDPFMCQECVDM